jgi:hypothetical protein
MYFVSVLSRFFILNFEESTMNRKIKTILSAILLLTLFSITGLSWAAGDTNNAVTGIASVGNVSPVGYGYGQAAASGGQVSIDSHDLYEKPGPTPYPVNGISTGLLSPNIFGPLDQGPNAAGTGFNVYALNVCHQANAAQDVDSLDSILVSGSSKRTTIVFDPLFGYNLKQPGLRKQMPRITEVLFDNQFDTESSYVCLGTALIQADEDDDMVYVTETGQFHDIESFLKSKTFQGYSYVVAMTTEATIANQRRLASDSIAGTIAPSITGAASAVLGGAVGGVSMAHGESNAQTKKGITFLIFAKLNPWEKGGKLITPPKTWDLKRQTPATVPANSNHIPQKAVGAGAVQ